MPRDVPTFVTHYYLADKRPFLNLSDLSESELPPVMKDLERRRVSAGLKRVFGSRYSDKPIQSFLNPNRNYSVECLRATIE